MIKLSQKELLGEGFSDIVRGAASALKSAAEVALPGTSGALGRYKQNINKVTGAFTKNQPVAFLKNKLKGNTAIEFVKLIKETKKQADINKPWYKRISGPKSVTLVEFMASVYLKGKDDKPLRGYRMYNTDDPYSSMYENTISSNIDILLEGRRKRKRSSVPRKRQITPSGTTEPADETKEEEIPPSETTEGQPEESNKILVAEIFRTSEGLELGDIYDKKTNQVYTKYVNKYGGGPSPSTGRGKVSRKLKTKKFEDRAKERARKGYLSNSSDLKEFLIDIYDEFEHPNDFAKFAELNNAIGQFTGINDLSNIVSKLKRSNLLEHSQLDTLQGIILVEKSFNNKVD